MNKKLIMIASIVVVAVMAVTGTALAYNGNGANDGSAARFAASAADYATPEEFHAAILAEKMEIIKAKLADGSMTTDEANALIEFLNSCDADGDCTMDGTNPNRPEEGWGIFGRGTGDGVGVGGGNGFKGGNGARGTGLGLACDEDGVPLLDGSGNAGAQGHRGGRN